MKDHRREFDVSVMCRVLHASKSGFYDWLLRSESISRRQKERYLRLLDIEKIYKNSRATYGARRVHAVMKGMGHKISRPTVGRLMTELGIKSKVKRRFKNTTDSNHKFAIAPNLVKREFKGVKKPNSVWLSDITYVQTNEGWLYVATIMDLCTRKIIGWCLDETLHQTLVHKALRMAVLNQNPPPGVIFHSDRGVQYAAHHFKDILVEYGFIQSMSRKGDCWDNAPMESFFHTFKTEFIYHENFATRSLAKSKIFEWIESFYNRKRIHSSLGYKTPLEMEELFMQDAA